MRVALGPGVLVAEGQGLAEAFREAASGGGGGGPGQLLVVGVDELLGALPQLTQGAPPLVGLGNLLEMNKENILELI